MTVSWPTNVNQRILRDNSDWAEPEGFIEDDTLSGKTRRRGACSMGKRAFNVKMRFTKTEYDLFRAWYVGVCRYGLNNFEFPKIDASGTGTYRFKKGGAPKENNPSGDKVNVQMVWEEV